MDTVKIFQLRPCRVPSDVLPEAIHNNSCCGVGRINGAYVLVLVTEYRPTALIDGPTHLLKCKHEYK